MKLTILFGQRICDYEGQYMPESLEVACDAVMDVNPTWIHEQKQDFYDTGEFESLELVEIELDEEATKAIYDRLTKNLSVSGSIKASSAQQDPGRQ